MIDLEIYATEDGREPFSEWVDDLSSKQAKSRILATLTKMQTGLFSDSKPVGEGVQEVRIHCECGYRIYYANNGPELVIILAGSDKKHQAREIKKAKEYWLDYKARQKAGTKRRTKS